MEKLLCLKTNVLKRFLTTWQSVGVIRINSTEIVCSFMLCVNLN